MRLFGRLLVSAGQGDVMAKDKPKVILLKDGQMWRSASKAETIE